MAITINVLLYSDATEVSHNFTFNYLYCMSYFTGVNIDRP